MELKKLKAKKSLGQYFLKDAAVLQRIVKSAQLLADDTVIEIGPGQGALTELLAQKYRKVITVELDDRLIPILLKKFKDNDKVKIIQADILKLNLPKLIENNNSLAKDYKVIANLPYYITSPIIRLFLETKYPPKIMVLMVQKEVAERICAKKGNMSLLAVSVQYYAQPEYLFTVLKEAFYPVPEIDSAVIKITYYQRSAVGDQKDTKNFFRVVKIGFSAKRKTLANNLSNGLCVDKNEIEEKLKSLGLSKNTRAQELDVDDWKKLSQILD